MEKLAKRNCPGQDTRYWTPKDIYEVACPHCSGQVEYFKDDLRRACPHCGKFAINPKNDLACAAWCNASAECLEQAGKSPPSGESDSSLP